MERYRGEMTPKQRVMAAIERRPVDRTPILPFIREYGMAQFGYTFADCFADHRKFVETQIGITKKYELDCVWDLMMISPEAEAMGCKQMYTDGVEEDDPPSIVYHPLKENPDLSQLKINDPHRDGKMPFLLNIVRDLRKALGPDIPIVGFSQMGFRNAIFLRGIDEFMMDLYKNEKYIFDLLEIATEGCIVWEKALVDAGADIVLHASPLASGHFISREFYQKFALPFDTKQFNALHEFGGKAMYHICGWWNDRWDLVLQTGAEIISIDSSYVRVPMEEAAKGLGPYRAVLGNVDVARTILKAPKEQVYAETMESLRYGHMNPGFLLSGACVVPRDTKVENFETFVRAAKDFDADPDKYMS